MGILENVRMRRPFLGRNGLQARSTRVGLISQKWAAYDVHKGFQLRS